MPNGWARRCTGDFGTSFQNSVPVGPELLARIPVTLELAVLAFLIANLIAIPLGIAAGCAAPAARRQDLHDARDHPRSGAELLAGDAAGDGVHHHICAGCRPAASRRCSSDPVANLQQMIMPALSLGLVSSALLLRIMRSSMIEVLSSDYIRTAHAKGAPERIVIRRHALRNALIPYLNVAAVEFGFLFGSVVVIEDIFQLPGIGSLVLVGIINRDYPVLLASALTITLFVLVVNLIVDIAVGLLDPRRVQGSEA